MSEHGSDRRWKSNAEHRQRPSDRLSVFKPFSYGSASAPGLRAKSEVRANE